MTDVISEFAQFRSLLDLGLQINQADLSFEKVMMFSWIKEAIDNGRKN